MVKVHIGDSGQNSYSTCLANAGNHCMLLRDINIITFGLVRGRPEYSFDTLKLEVEDKDIIFLGIHSPSRLHHWFEREFWYLKVTKYMLFKCRR